MHRNILIKWILNGRNLWGILKRLAITIILIPVFVLGLIKFLSFIEKLKYKSYGNYGFIFNHININKFTLSIICFILAFMILAYFIFNKLKIIILKRRKRLNRYEHMGPIRYYDLDREYYSLKKVLAILGVIFLFSGIYFINKTVLITTDKIVVTNLIPFLEKEYYYEDIEEVTIKINSGLRRNIVKYSINTKDNKKIVLKDEDVRHLLELNERIEAENIIIKKETKYLNTFLESLNESEIESYKKLFK